MHQKFKLCSLLLLICSLMPVQREGLAAEPEETASYDLGEIVVTGKTDGVQAAESIYTVTAEDIRNRDARTLEQALTLLPGLNVRTGGEGVPRIDIRGFRTRHVILLLDGVPLNSALDSQFDPTIIPTENIARIKLTAGPSSVLYGQGGLGGVINIITKKGSAGLQGTVSAETGDHAPILGRASISGARGMFDFFLSGSSTKINGFPLSDDFSPTSEQGSGYRNNSDKERHNVFGTLGFTPNRDLNLGFTFSYSRGSFGKPSTTISDPNSLDIFASPSKFERIDDFEGYSLQLAADYQITNQLSLRGWTFLNRMEQQDNLYDNANFNSFVVRDSFQEQVRTSIYGVSLQPKYDLGSAGTATFALYNEWDDWKNEGTVTGDSNVPNQSLNRSKSFSIHTIALEYEISPIKGLGLSAGYGHHWQVRHETSDTDFSVTAGIYYDILQDTRIRASYSRNIRFPSLGDLYDLTKGNPDLATERSNTYEGGIEQRLPFNSKVSMTGFYTIAKNLIQNDQNVGKNSNLSEVNFSGFELTGETNFVKPLLLRASYTYLDSRDKSRAGRDQLQYTPGNKLTLEGKYDFDCGFTPYASLLYVGNQYFYTKNNVQIVQKLGLEDYVLVNVKLSQRLFDNRATLYVGANNLFDQNYETSYGFPQAGRFIYGGVEFRL